MFDDLEVKNQVTLTQGDTVWTFEVKALDEDTEPEADRRYYWYIKEQIKSTQGNYSGKVLHGRFEKFDRQGNLLEKGQFIRGLKTGPWVSYYLNGNLARTMQWDEGWRTGRFEEYYSSGTLSRSGSYTKNKLSGTVNVYHPDGTLNTATRYKNGVPVVKRVKVGPSDSTQQIRSPEAKPSKAKLSRHMKREIRKAEAQHQKELEAARDAAQQADPGAQPAEAPKEKRKRKKKSETETVQP